MCDEKNLKEANFPEVEVYMRLLNEEEKATLKEILGIAELERRVDVLETNPLPVHDHSINDTYFYEE